MFLTCHGTSETTYTKCFILGWPILLPFSRPELLFPILTTETPIQSLPKNMSLVINKHGRNWRVAKSCDLQSQSPFVRCQDKKCNVGHSVQTDQNDENLSSSQFMSRIEQSVFPTTLLQLKTLPEIWFPTDWLLQIPPPCSALPRSGCGESVYNWCTKSSKLDKFQFSNYSESVTRLIMILHDSVVRGHVSLTPLSERKSHQPIREPIWGNWSKPPTTRFPFLNHFIRPGLHSGSCRQNKISRQLTYYNHNCFFKKIMRKLKKKSKI